jgi:hypothetical protein
MAETVAREFVQFVASVRRAAGAPTAARAIAEGEVVAPVVVGAKAVDALLRVAARRAAGLFRPSRHTEVVWVDGDSELAVGIAGVTARLDRGLVRIRIPVRCDQTGDATVEVPFACGSAERPSGLYAAAQRRPTGPELIVATWGDALVAFAWQVLLGLVSGLAAASGKDARGNLLVPVEMSATARGIEIVPMARHRFSGSSGLSSSAGTVRR